MVAGEATKIHLSSHNFSKMLEECVILLGHNNWQAGWLASWHRLQLGMRKLLLNNALQLLLLMFCCCYDQPCREDYFIQKPIMVSVCHHNTNKKKTETAEIEWKQKVASAEYSIVYPYVQQTACLTTARGMNCLWFIRTTDKTIKGAQNCNKKKEKKIKEKNLIWKKTMQQQQQ